MRATAWAVTICKNVYLFVPSVISHTHTHTRTYRRISTHRHSEMSFNYSLLRGIQNSFCTSHAAKSQVARQVANVTKMVPTRFLAGITGATVRVSSIIAHRPGNTLFAVHVGAMVL